MFLAGVAMLVWLRTYSLTDWSLSSQDVLEQGDHLGVGMMIVLFVVNEWEILW